MASKSCIARDNGRLPLASHQLSNDLTMITVLAASLGVGDLEFLIFRMTNLKTTLAIKYHLSLNGTERFSSDPLELGSPSYLPAEVHIRLLGLMSRAAPGTSGPLAKEHQGLAFREPRTPITDQVFVLFCLSTWPTI